MPDRDLADMPRGRLFTPAEDMTGKNAVTEVNGRPLSVPYCKF